MSKAASPTLADVRQFLQTKTAEAESQNRITAVGDQQQVNQLLSILFGGMAQAGHGVERVEVVEDATINRVIMPKGWNAYKLHKYATAMIENEEAPVQIHHAIHGIPADVLVCMWRELEEKYNFAAYLADKTWFGDIPPTMVNIQTGPGGESISIPFSKISPPAWEQGYIRPEIIAKDGMIAITGTFKRKFEPEVKALIKGIENRLATNSIYRGKSIILNFDWKKQGIAMSIDHHSPSFEKPTNIKPEDVILNDGTAAAIKSALFSRIQHADICAENGIPFKHGVVIAGPYGTGKTMTGAMLSNMATDNSITFIHLKDATFLADALLIAKNYGKVVLFCEDIDAVAGGEERNEEMNLILNTIDGADTKGMEVICIFTTNHPERLNSAFMRAGRVDSFIFMGHPDEKSAVKFMFKYGQNLAGESLLSPDIDIDACGKALAEKSPAFIAGIVNTAKTLIIADGHHDLRGKIGTAHIIDCAKAVEDQIKMTQKEKPNHVKVLGDALKVTGDLFMGRSSIVAAALLEGESTSTAA